MRPRGLYIHIPFCKQKCNYCDFASFAGKEQARQRYLCALEKEAAAYADPSYTTLYVGGGTPSLLTVPQLQTLGRMVTKYFGPVAHFVESTFEANPESLTAEKIACLRALGFNRLSMGLQSFHDTELKTLGRVHNAAQFLTAYQAAHRGGFENINVDLIAGVPGQSLQSFSTGLGRLVEVNPKHISVYGLQIEEGTPFFAQGVTCDQGLMRQMLEKAHEVLTQSGYHHYEISNYAKPGYESKHNTLYWQNGSYLGLGSAAASYQKGVRRQNEPGLEAYISCVEAGEKPTAFSERLTGKAKEGENLFLALRQLDGTELTARQRAWFGAEIERHVKNGLLTQAGKKVKLSKEGLYLANEVFRSFVAPFEDA
ncbi:MAG: radical SAM family heme chaperone HemW [Elusimicrobiaceae bacterium]|nr:radical SAM family heme chaperone HemW [Elusimicrobiaceae bacterium]